ncbi:MAG: Wzz/FepE/Etk N-terminal domain-containing protein [Deltaproteobacteria bacterium]|nr:Wzz/FepE/Etk N-terminal domain-containing protein [Deltaproteobacteria bacterium]
MEERRQEELTGAEITLGDYLTVLRPHWWKIALLSLVVGIVTLLVMFLIPNWYKAAAVITPTAEEKKSIPVLGTLASFGIEIGAPTKVEDLETLFKSNDLTVRVFRTHNLWSIVFPYRYEPKTGNLKNGLFSYLLGGENASRPPTDWDAIRAVKKRLSVTTQKMTGTVTVSFDSPSQESSANIVTYYLEEAKNRLQEEALERATRNKKFIEGQIGKTVDALTRERLYSLYGQEVEREMLARNREQFGFRVIDSPRVPDRKSGPHRVQIAFTATILSSIFWSLVFIWNGRWRRKKVMD